MQHTVRLAHYTLHEWPLQTLLYTSSGTLHCQSPHFLQCSTPTVSMLHALHNRPFCAQDLIAARHSIQHSPGRFAQLFSGTSLGTSPSNSGPQHSQNAPSTSQDKSVTPQHRRQGLLNQLSALSSENQDLRAQVLAAQQDALSCKAESEAAVRKISEAAAATASLKAEVLLT